MIVSELKHLKDYHELCKLRYTVYVENGNIQPDGTGAFYDTLDSISTNIIMKDDNEKIIAGVRVTLSNKGIFEANEYISMFLNKNVISAEIARFVIDKAYQKKFSKKNVFMLIVNELFKFGIANNITEAFTVTYSSNTPLYEKLGFKKIHGPFFYPGFNREHYLLNLQI